MWAKTFCQIYAGQKTLSLDYHQVLKLHINIGPNKQQTSILYMYFSVTYFLQASYNHLKNFIYMFPQFHHFGSFHTHTKCKLQIINWIHSHLISFFFYICNWNTNFISISMLQDVRISLSHSSNSRTNLKLDQNVCDPV